MLWMSCLLIKLTVSELHSYTPFLVLMPLLLEPYIKAFRFESCLGMGQWTSSKLAIPKQDRFSYAQLVVLQVLKQTMLIYCIALAIFFFSHWHLYCIGKHFLFFFCIGNSIVLLEDNCNSWQFYSLV